LRERERKAVEGEGEGEGEGRWLREGEGCVVRSMLVVNYEDFDKVMSTQYKRMCDFMKSHNKSGHE